MSPETLMARLSELREVGYNGRRRLKGASSLSQRFLSYLMLLDGHRLGGITDSEGGFCIVHLSNGGSKIYSSKGRLLLCRGLLNEELQPTMRLIDSIYKCTACGQYHDQISMEGLEMNNAIIKARQEITKKGMGPQKCMTILQNLRNYSYLMGMPSARELPSKTYIPNPAKSNHQWMKTRNHSETKNIGQQ
jgi:Fe-S oxidoreductase